MPTNEVVIPVAKALWLLIGVWVSIAVAKILISDEPFNLSRFIGEVILAGVGGFIFYSFGMYEGMEFWKIVFLGGLSGLGGVHVIEQGIKMTKTMKTL